LRKDRRGTGSGETAALFVDSSAWIALFSARDQNHGEADRLFRAAVSGNIPLFTTNLVVAEVHRLLLFRAGARPAQSALDRISSSEHVRIEFPGPEEHRGARAWLQRLDRVSLTYTDAVGFAVMESLRCRFAISFDQHFEVAGFVLWSGGGESDT
jgi:uncharacterized protein